MRFLSKSRNHQQTERGELAAAELTLRYERVREMTPSGGPGANDETRRREGESFFRFDQSHRSLNSRQIVDEPDSLDSTDSRTKERGVQQPSNPLSRKIRFSVPPSFSRSRRPRWTAPLPARHLALTVLLLPLLHDRNPPPLFSLPKSSTASLRTTTCTRRISPSKCIEGSGRAT